MSTMGERLRIARVAAHYETAAKAAAALGVSVSSYRAHENGQNEFSAEVAQRYAKKFNTTAAYLLTGEGPSRVERPRLVSSFDPDAPESDEEEFTAVARDTWQPVVPNAIPEVDGKLGAGMGQVGEVINIPVGKDTVSGHKVVAEWLLPVDYLRNEAKVSPQSTLVMEIIGDSMQPTYLPGDRVLVDLSQNYMQSDTVYAISDGFAEPQIKRLQRVPFSNPPQVIIISDNPSLQSFTVELERLTIIGRICAVVARR